MYSLLRACNIVRSTDNSEGRLKVFGSVLGNSRKIRWAYKLYLSSPGPVKAALVVVYGLKCFLSLAMPGDRKICLLFFASYPNERNVLGHVRQNLDSIEHGEVTISLRNCFKPSGLADLITYLAASARLYRYAFKLVRRYSFMPACRIFSVVAYYMRFKRLLAGSNIKAVFIANHYSPECLGLATAAHDGQMKVLLTNHASGTGETGYVAPVYADLAAVTSQAMADLYRKYSPKGLQIIRLAIATPQKPMTIPARGQRSLVAGIYLTALTNETRLRELVAELLKAGNIATVFIRIHPADVVNSDLSGIVANGKPIEISQHKPLSEDIERTDLAIVGNSSVTIELLRGGCPVLYDHRLDEIVYDYNGFEGRGLVLAFPARLQKKFLDDVEAHYGSQAWIETMRYFDWGYQRDEKTMLRDFKSAVLRTVAPS